jgi:cation diffusion facilitator CzcD-associated flavoprotein CzcO
VTADGQLHELDVLILATGFHAHSYMRPMRVVSAGGRTLDEAWKDGPAAHRTIGIPGFPNMFLIMGPHSPLVSISIHGSIELQADYVLQTLEVLDRPGVVSVAPTAEAGRRWMEEVSAGMPGTVWTTGCNSWYVGSESVPVLWPFSERRWVEMLRRPDWSEFEIVSRRASATETAPA